MKVRLVDLLLLAALIAGVSFYFTHWLEVAGWAKVVWKGSGVGLLSAWAFARGRPWIGLVLGLGALGDVLLETMGLTIGAVAFLVGHVLAVSFYWRSRRLAAAVPVGIALAVSVVSFLLSGDIGVAFYGLGVGAMAGAAVASSYRLAGVGAVSFLLSDLLIFAKMGPLSASDVPGLVIWPTYFAGQALIAWSVVRSERRENLHDRI
ncbi:lysoplasmalogenase family protein [Sphingomonas sp. M1-B02]|uniref:lysoplasmalogenase family protein n=1 Tax=Sphingomonas sp. M1-B02 TaxID=3114300 RepID=UPI00223F6137|nr:lysoplasmalogenase family protein [Sphingomonas sp. S6-11]UZK66836.1 lysoplasmalogenase [Sphingomonas sp. S6-11]